MSDTVNGRERSRRRRSPERARQEAEAALRRLVAWDGFAGELGPDAALLAQGLLAALEWTAGRAADGGRRPLHHVLDLASAQPAEERSDG
jgi:hypothetical protein